MIRVYNPWVAKNEKRYLNQLVDENMLTFHGEFTQRFEKQITDYLGVKHAIMVMNGTQALTAIYEAANLRGKMVATSTLTYAATTMQLILGGATPVLIAHDDHLQIDLSALCQALRKFPITAVVVPPLYADMPDMHKLLDICDEYKVTLLEDAAEAFGCVRDGLTAGTVGEMGTFSFFANKVITTGEGGAVVTNSDEKAAWLRMFINQGVTRRFWHEMVGTNLRATNMQAAIGCAQMEDLPEILAKKRQLAADYRSALSRRFSPIVPKAQISCEWMPVFRLGANENYAAFEHWMNKHEIEVRPVFTPLHAMPVFQDKCEIGDWTFGKNGVADKHFILPSSPDLTGRAIDYITEIAQAF